MFPILFTIAGFEVRSYGVLIAAGILAGVYIGEKEIRRKGLLPGTFVEFIPRGIILGLAASRLTFVLTHMENFTASPLQAFNLRAGGLNFYGGLAGGLIAALIFLGLRKIPFGKFSDCAAPALAAALFFGRIGCFLNGCCFGTSSSLPWAAVYSSPRSSAPLHTPLHPSQLYEAAGNLLLLGLLWSVRKKPALSGRMFYLFLFLYSGLRFFLERFRGDTLAYITPNFAWTDLFFIVIMTVSAIMILNTNRGKAKCPRKEKSRQKKQKNSPGSHSP